jgi:beta-lactamase class D
MSPSSSSPMIGWASSRAVRRWAAGVLCAVLALVWPDPIEAQEPMLESDIARAAMDETGFRGAILILDVNGGVLTAGHGERIDDRLIPASTFKIFSSLVALETGVIADGDAVIEWDGITRSRSETNRDLDLRTAFQISAVPHYQELVRRVGVERMQHYIDAVGYGNQDISGGVDEFWLTGALRISPREQVDLLVRLYRGDLPFSQRTMAEVRRIMEAEGPVGYTLRAKTGWAQLPGEENVGWWVGWVERDSRVHMFATVLEGTAPDASFGPSRQGVTLQVLEALGILESGP